MTKSSIPIISYIPRFLDYCEIEKGLSDRTQKDYQHYLKKFVFWLKNSKKENLLPHELTADDIWAYRLYLSRFRDKKGKTLKKVTQNYYLIALRALLSYFRAKMIDCRLTFDQIKLLEDVKVQKTTKFLNLEQLERLLLAPDTKNLLGLRDRAILITLVTTGLKISQLIKLNRDNYDLPGEALPWIKEYLKTRKDKNSALFINYRSRRNADKRLTARSIERIVNRYGRKVNLPFLVTPEVLRWSRAFTLLNEEVEIKYPKEHKTLITKNYKISFFLSSPKSVEKHSPTWHTIENIINKEVLWLKNGIPVMPQGYKENPPFLKCDDCILRKIAILIVSGKSNTIEYQAEKNKDLWNNLTKKLDLKKISRHGEEWHKKMMDVIYEYFKQQNYKVVFEPILNYGRADLGIYSKGNRSLFIEVGTVSLFKLWYNLSSMKNIAFLLIPSENKAIEFNT